MAYDWFDFGSGLSLPLRWCRSGLPLPWVGAGPGCPSLGLVQAPGALPLGLCRPRLPFQPGGYEHWVPLFWGFGALLLLLLVVRAWVTGCQSYEVVRPCVPFLWVIVALGAPPLGVANALCGLTLGRVFALGPLSSKVLWPCVLQSLGY